MHELAHRTPLDLPRPADADALRAHQRARLDHLLREIGASNEFYRPRLRRAGLDAGLPEGMDLSAALGRLPFTTKGELVADQAANPPYGTDLTYPVERYARLHATSGTSGEPLRWLDTPESWRWCLRSWARVFEACGVGAGDRVFFPFSFGPFLGFWTAFEAAWQIGCLTLPGGGMTSKARLRVLVENDANVICATPTYALRLAQTAAEDGVATPSVEKILVASEPGGSVPAVRRRLSEAWGGARVYDHHGMTEVGPVSYPSPVVDDVLHVIGTSYVAEVLELGDDDSLGDPVAPGETGELVLTTLGRVGSPLLRYRTGDLVRLSKLSPAELGTPDPALDGGILSRTDDMVVIRGVNLYPSAIDSVVRDFEEVAEYRVDVWTERGMKEARVVIEPTRQADSNMDSDRKSNMNSNMDSNTDTAADGVADRAADGAESLARRVAEALRTCFQLRIPVTVARDLPRFELKARRWHVLDGPPA